MSPFSYLSVLISIILALGVTRIVTGIGRLLQLQGSVRNSWLHLVWSANVFLYLALTWWILFRWSAQTEWTFFLFLFVLVSPTISYLLTVLLFPDPLGQTEDMEAHFFANRKRFFVLAAILPAVDVADTLLKGVDHFRAQGAIYPVTIATVFVCCLVGAGTSRRGYHAFFALFFLAYLLTFIAINLAELA